MAEDCALIGAARAAGYEDAAAVRAAIERALGPLGGIGAFVRPGARVLLKPNFVRAMDPATGGVTHPVFIAEAARLARDAGASEVLVGDSPAFGSAANAARAIGLEPLLADCGARVIEFRAVRRISSPHNGRFKALTQAGDAHEADVLINLAKPKAHCQMVMTCAVKNLFGCIPGRKKALMHCLVENNRYTFGRMLVENARTLAPELHLADGIIAMEGMGPTRGTPRQWGWVLAATDGVALDRLVAEAMGYALEEVPHLCAAADMNAGVTDLGCLDLRGAAIDSMRIEGWERARMHPITFNPLRLCVSYIKHLRQLRPAG